MIFLRAAPRRPMMLLFRSRPLCTRKRPTSGTATPCHCIRFRLMADPAWPEWRIMDGCQVFFGGCLPATRPQTRQMAGFVRRPPHSDIERQNSILRQNRTTLNHQRAFAGTRYRPPLRASYTRSARASSLTPEAAFAARFRPYISFSASLSRYIACPIKEPPRRPRRILDARRRSATTGVARTPGRGLMLDHSTRSYHGSATKNRNALRMPFTCPSLSTSTT